MPVARDTLTGTRIRERRTALGLKQAELASEAGISPSYLNLIEHNRRRIGGKLLLAIAEQLDVEPSVLSEGAETRLIAALREAAAAQPRAGAEIDRIDEFAGRFPGWAALVEAMQARIGGLEQTVETLTDRLTHDPYLATALHEMLTTVTAIRSTAGILSDSPDIEAEWRARFHRNINEDAARLADSSTALVSYLEAGDAMADRGSTPEEEVEVFLSARAFHHPEIERGGAGAIDRLVEEAEELSSEAARDVARRYLARYAAMAHALPLEAAMAQATQAEADAAAFCTAMSPRAGGLIPALHRWATLPTPQAARTGFVLCDASGTFVARKQLDHFPLPRFGAACPLWPLFAALGAPGRPLRQVVEQSAREARRFETFAIAEPVAGLGFGAPPRIEAAMLFHPEPVDDSTPAAPPAARVGAPGERGETAALRVGVSCRICAHEACSARREASVLSTAARSAPRSAPSASSATPAPEAIRGPRQGP
jgi:predicted transcriptional regulator/transcriptional regulator with XRE-family HTH domain